MNDVIDNIILLKQRLINLENVEFGIKGDIPDLKSEDINVITNVWEYIDDIFSPESGGTIYKEDINNFISQNICLTIKTGDIPNYYENFNDFLSGNKIKCSNINFYIEKLNYRDGKTVPIPTIINHYKSNLEIISLLDKIADYKKEQGNRLELFFYKSENGVSLNINYNEKDLQSLKANRILDLRTQLLNNIDSNERKQLFVNELISELNKNGNLYKNLLENWDSIVNNYERSFRLYLSGFSFDKIKTSSVEYFQKLTDRIYETISKVSGYIFGIPIGYILLLNNFDFTGKSIEKNIALLFLGVLFFILMWFVFFKNIDESISAIEKDISKFKDKIEGRDELKEILNDLKDLESKSIKKQKNKLLLVKILTIVVLVVTIVVLAFIYKNILSTKLCDLYFWLKSVINCA
ncbi:hypothetical protein ETU08_09050 [Apibacter muscae]|uniref:hypothetical protein n=1 Tax=Apibacter muscae TaxID=2509004 RepID=UPI0011AC1BF9|nr:hypothetical protein [Apibacter muscae]TWP28579.1 hypothetical protein ETU08_09050 [Apibacter muscae]